ncbi:unnamed protein product, partial [Ectocarpus fasciculatus]
MAFAGEVGCGLDVDVPAVAGGEAGVLDALFSEEVGFVVEVSEARLAEVTEAYKAAGINAVDIGKVTDDGKVSIKVGGEEGIE